MRFDDRPIAVCVRNRHNEGRRAANSFGECGPLQLSRSQLSLEIQHGAFDLDRHQRTRGIEHDIDCAAITAGPHRNLEAHSPRWMGSSSEHLGDTELARVTQANPISREEAQGEVVPRGCRQPMHHLEARCRVAVFDLAHKGLTDAGALSDLVLRESSDRTSRGELPSKASRYLVGTRAKSDSGRRHGADGGRRRSPSGYR
jgi:hypothetical protein